jgi:starch synthase
MTRLEIWMAAAEAAPVAQTGGLADVVRALPAALARRGHAVRVFLPAYGRIDRAPYSYDAAEDHFDVPLGIGRVPVRFLSRSLPDGVRLTLVQCEELFGRDGLYGPPGGEFPDNARRFALFASAVASLASRAPRTPDVLHGHDWHAALLPLYAGRLVPFPGRRPVTVQTIHNMGYQGRFGTREIDWIAPPGAARDGILGGSLEHDGDLNYLKAALVYADRLTAVSPRYAWEITTMEGGFGLHELAWGRRGDLTGILNGADYERWDPARDPHLPERYDASTLHRKETARIALRAAFGLAGAATERPAGAPAPRPIAGVVSRLVEQKGIDLLLAAAPAILRGGADLIVLGAGEPSIVDGVERLRAAHPGRVGIYVGFNDPLAHLVVAGSDLLLVPSRYEPCGLVQMHALRYGTIPVVRRTGGLADTVRDEGASPGHGNGFLFEEVDSEALAHAAHRALILKARDAGAWRDLQRRAMAEDFSWDRSAAAYEEVYTRARA